MRPKSSRHFCRKAATRVSSSRFWGELGLVCALTRNFCWIFHRPWSMFLFETALSYPLHLGSLQPWNGSWVSEGSPPSRRHGTRCSCCSLVWSPLISWRDVMMHGPRPAITGPLRVIADNCNRFNRRGCKKVRKLALATSNQQTLVTVVSNLTN